MAKMYPARFPDSPEGDSGVVGERLVYEALSRLPDDWTIIYNCWRHVFVQKKGCENELHHSYEADFVLLIPGHGILVLEVKNWLHAKVENGCWLRGRKDGTGYKTVKYGSPLNQAYLACLNLQTELKKNFRWGLQDNPNMEFRCAVFLLGNVENYVGLAEVPADARAVDVQKSPKRYRYIPRNEVYERLYLCGSDKLEHGLQQHLESLFCFRNATTAEELDDVRRYLLQNMVMQVDAATATHIINNAAAPLFSILPMLEESSGGVHVKGCAGSGKSSMLCAEAARLARACAARKNGERVLVLCFNLNLAEYLRSNKELVAAGVRRFDSSSCLVLDNFHNVANLLCKWCGLPTTDHRKSLPPDVLELLADRLLASDRFSVDYIFVDEAQDFPKSWWKVVRALLKPSGRLYLFSDAGQKLYGRADSIPPLPVQLRLTRNLRNSAPISAFASAALPQTARSFVETLLLPGPSVCVKPAADSYEARANAVRLAIKELLNEDFALHDIVVLTPWRHNNSLTLPVLSDIVDFPAPDETRENADKRLERCLSPGATRVLGETVKAFKGMESLAVILTDVSAPKDDPSSGFTTAEFYVACTRARFKLIIIPTTSGAEFVSQLPLSPPILDA